MQCTRQETFCSSITKLIPSRTSISLCAKKRRQSLQTRSRWCVSSRQNKSRWASCPTTSKNFTGSAVQGARWTRLTSTKSIQLSSRVTACQTSPLLVLSANTSSMVQRSRRLPERWTRRSSLQFRTRMRPMASMGIATLLLQMRIAMVPKLLKAQVILKTTSKGWS